MQDLDPQLLQELLALRNQRPGTSNGHSQTWFGPGNENSNNGWRLYHERGGGWQGGDAGDWVADPSQDINWITKVREDTGGNLGDYWDLDGKYGGTYEALNGGGRELNTAIALMAAGYFGGGALNNAVNGAGAAAGTGMTASQQAAMMAANGMTDAEIAAALGSQGANAAGLSGVTGGAATAGGAGVTGSQMASGAKTLYDGLGGAKGIATLAGAVAGAADSGDKTQSSSRDPWAPMQPYLKGLAADGADLYAKYKAQPFSQAQQTAYANQGGLLDSLNQATPGLLAAMQMTAGGGNQFRRGQQNSVPTYGWAGLGWQPQSYGNFGTKG